MMKRLWKTLMTAIFLTSFMHQATADQPHNPSAQSQTSSQQTGISQQKAIVIAQQHFSGRVLAVNPVDDTYRIKILNQKGIIHTVVINAADGTVLPAR